MKEATILPDVLNKGDTVMWRANWGLGDPKPAKVKEISVGSTDSDSTVEAIEWSKVHNTRSVIVDLDNGHWAYGFQISKHEEAL